MGFTKSGSTITLEAYLTQKGREKYLSSDESSKTIKKFSLGDSDTNYVIATNTRKGSDKKNTLERGLVPDLTGDQTDCIKSLTDDIQIKNPIFVNQQINSNYKNNYEIRFFGDTFTSGKNILRVKINLDVYFNWLLEHGKFVVNDFNSSNNLFSANISPNFNRHEPSLGDPILKLYNNISIINLRNFNITNNPLFIKPNIYDLEKFQQLNYFSSEYLPPDFTGTTSRLIYKPNFYSSLFQFLFTSNANAGASSGRFMIFGRQYGYASYNDVNEYYNNPDAGVFVNPSQYESNNPSGGNIVSDITTVNNNEPIGSNFIVPAILIKYKKANNTMVEKIYPVRFDAIDIGDGAEVIFNDYKNQYLKLYSRNNKSAIEEEVAAAKEFIRSRTDLFDRKNVRYTSKVNLKFDTDNILNNDVKPAYLKIELKYDLDESSTNYNDIIEYI